jgi:hypothetical protein
MTKTTGKTIKTRKLALRQGHIYIYGCLCRFSGVISTLFGRKVEDHSWQETTDYDQF